MHVGRRGGGVARGQDVDVQSADVGRHELPQELPADAPHGGQGQVGQHPGHQQRRRALPQRLQRKGRELTHATSSKSPPKSKEQR